MDVYWMFLKTIVNTMVSLIVAAFALFTSARPPEVDRPRLPAFVRASFGAGGGPAITRGGQWSADAANRLAAELQANDPARRARAACEIGRAGAAANSMIPRLVDTLADDATVAGDVCGDWGRRTSHGEVADTTPGERAAAALVKIGTVSVEPLIGALNDRRWHARRSAAWALGALDDARAVQPLIAALGDAEPPVRRNAAWALGALDDDRAVDALMAALGDADADTRAQAAWALGAIDAARAAPALVRALSDSDVRVRRQAAWALGAIGSAEGVDGLLRTLEQDRDAAVRSQAAWALGAIGDGRASAALAVALKDPDAKVRRQAAWALGAVAR
ncbi:MAG TPA: HEAT repeat domain-containing protein [Vicinamibacterales bacterium]|nr:HEAT repeat domain-containing protein [Vicinamibacterales bacterium]